MSNMKTKQKRVSAFKVKQMEVSLKGKKSKHKTRPAPGVIKLDTSLSGKQSSKQDVDKKRKKKKSKKTKEKVKSKGNNSKEIEGMSKSDGVEEIDTIEILDDESDSCIIVEESVKSVKERQVGKSTDQVAECSQQIEEKSCPVETSIRKKGDKRKKKTRNRDVEIVYLKQDANKTDTNAMKNKRKQSNDEDIIILTTNKRTKTDNGFDRQAIPVDESASWITVGERVGDENSNFIDEQTETTTEKAGIAAAAENSPVAIPVEGSVLVVATHPCIFPLKGQVKVQALVGVTSIMGYHLLPGSKSFDIFSPDCNSLITVATVSGKTNIRKSLQKVDSVLGISDSSVLQILQKTLMECKPYVILKFDKLETNLYSFLSSFHPYTNIFKVAGDRSVLNKQLLPLSIISPKDSEVPKLCVTEELLSVIDVWMKTLKQPCEGQPVMVICGGKDSGKSTTNRLLINSSLNVLKSVYYLECDIGQSEFTPSGVVSLVKVTSPVLGPPFTHQRKTVCSYHFGGVTPKDDPDLYMLCLQLCVTEYRNTPKPGPLIVNTMGWMKGLGWQLLLDTIRLVSPSIILQLTSNQNSQNVAPLTVSSLKETSWTDLSKMYDGPHIERKMKQIPKMIHIEVPVSTSYNFKMKSTDYRNLAILSHLGRDLEPGLTLTSVTPYTVNWKDVAIHMCHVEVPRSQVMYALNANLVALCEGDITKAEKFSDDGPLFLTSKGPCKWVGYGLVRGIDMEKKVFYIISSLSEEDLARVTVLDIGGVSVPENFLIAQKCERMLYVDEVVESIGLSAVRPRKHMPRKNLRGNTPR